jgi:hypothetical protein
MRSPSLFVRALPLLVAGSVLAPSSAQAIPLTPDTFQDGTTMGWFVPGIPGVPPGNQPDGGPAGAGDAYLQLVSTGVPGPGSRLSVLNGAQWMGDYLAAGITAIAMDVNNFGPDDLVLRLLFETFGPAPGPPTDLAVTVADVVVPAGSGWVPVVFDLSAANLSALAGTVNGALGDVSVLRIFHNTDPDHPGPNVGPPLVAATLGVDNIAAVGAVPEPFSAVLLTGGVAAYLLRRRQLRRI